MLHPFNCLSNPLIRFTISDEPMLTGSCVHTGITAILNFHWSVFKFSLVFDENPEGNSYYLNKAVLEYNQVTLQP